MTTNNGAQPSGEDFNWSETDDDFLDLSPDTGNPPPAEEPSDLSLSDIERVVTDLSGAEPKTVPVQASSSAPAQGAESPPAATPPAPSGQQPAASVPPAPSSAAPAVQQPAASAQPGSAAPQQAVDIEAYVTQNADAIIDNLAKSHFAIDDQTAEELGFAPEVKGWIEKQNAKNFLVTMVQVNKALQQTLPSVVANLVQMTNEARQTQDKFFGEFPDLQKKEYVPHLRRLASTLRGMHPTMEASQFQTLLGRTALTMWGITPKAAPNGGKQLVRGPARPFAPAGSAVPQRNMGGNGAQQTNPLHAMNEALRFDADDYT